MLVRSFLPDNERHRVLAYSPMYHSRLFNQTPTYRHQHFEPRRRAGPGDTDWSGDAFLDGNPTMDRPLIVQFCANDPDELLAAATRVALHCDAIDLNLGCPQGIAKRGRYGAFLADEPELVTRLVRTLHERLPVPVTAKIRVRETREATLEYARAIVDAGASILAVHGRTRDQKGHATGLADWVAIRHLRDHLPPETVIFANGNVLAHGDLDACLDATGADAVLSAEGCLSDPAIFGPPPPPLSETTPERPGPDPAAYWRGPDGRGGWRLDFVLRRYLDILYNHVLETAPPTRPPLYVPGTPYTPIAPDDSDVAPVEPDRKKRKRAAAAANAGVPKPPRCTSPNLLPVQGHLFTLLRPLISTGAPAHIRVRDALARVRAGDMDALERVAAFVADAVAAGIEGEVNRTVRGDKEDTTKEQASTNGKEEADGGAPQTGTKRPHERPRLAAHEGGSAATAAEYGRPWWVCQPYVRPLPAEAMASGALQERRKGGNESGSEAQSEAKSQKGER